MKKNTSSCHSEPKAKNLLFLAFFSSIILCATSPAWAGGGGPGCVGTLCGAHRHPAHLPTDDLYKLGTVSGIGGSGGSSVSDALARLRGSLGPARLELGSPTAQEIAKQVRDAATTFGKKGLGGARKQIRDKQKMEFLYGLERDLKRVADILDGKVPSVGAPGGALSGGIEVVAPPTDREQTVFGEYSLKGKKMRVYADPAGFNENPKNHPQVIGTIVHEIGHAIFHERGVAAGDLPSETMASYTMTTEIMSHALENVFSNPTASSGTIEELKAAPDLASYYAERGKELAGEHPRYEQMFSRYIDSGGMSPDEKFATLGSWAVGGSPTLVFPSAR